MSETSGPKFRRVTVPAQDTTPRYGRFIAAVIALGMVGGLLFGLIVLPQAFSTAERELPWWTWIASSGVGGFLGLIVAIVTVHMASRRRAQ